MVPEVTVTPRSPAESRARSLVHVLSAVEPSRSGPEASAAPMTAARSARASPWDGDGSSATRSRRSVRPAPVDRRGGTVGT
jgi:hypothetical protein